MRARFIVGDCLDVLPTLPAGSVDLVVASPPFLSLRSYLPADHPAKAAEHGSEPTPAAFLAVLLDVAEACGRTLAPHGSLCFELGDTYSGSGGGGGDYDLGGIREGQARFRGAAHAERMAHALVCNGQRFATGWPLAKSLCFVPQLFGASLAYGRNLLAMPGQPEWREFEPWRVRNVIAWCRPNPPVGALGDKWRPGTSYVTVATRARDRWWDDIPTRKEHKRDPEVNGLLHGKMGGEKGRNHNHGKPGYANGGNAAGAPLLDWWEIVPTGFTSRLGQHYATFPPELVTPLVQAMCPRRVCRACGTPSRRLQSKPEYVPSASYRGGSEWPDTERVAEGVNQWVGQNGAGKAPLVRSTETVGWTSCGCPGTEHTRDDGFHDGPAWRPGLVLDPYCGTFTTGLVADGHGRDAIGIDIDERNAILAEERLGMFLTIEGAA